MFCLNNPEDKALIWYITIIGIEKESNVKKSISFSNGVG